MKLNYLFLILNTFGITIKFGNSARILCLFPSPSKSHLIIDTAVAKGLANRGHNVTVITTMPIKIDENSNIEHIIFDMPEYHKKFQNIIGSLSSQSRLGMLFTSFHMFEYFAEYSAGIVKHSIMQKILNERDYDLLIIGYLFNNVHFGIGAHFKCPVVIIWVNQPIRPINNLVGNPSEISYVPSIFAELTVPMNFVDRLKNSAVYLFESVRDNYIYYTTKAFYNELFPAIQNYPSFDKILKNVSLILTASHFSDVIVRPNVPNLIEIGGVQIKGTPKALPEKLYRFLNSANNGAILFSLGSNAKCSDLDPIVTTKLFKILSNLPYKIIWKWETDNVPGNSENILYEKWLPQDDILSHSNIRAFISHGGLGGIAEARYHGVPIIGLPIFGDQPINLKAIESAGWAIVLDINQFSEDKFSNALHDILNKPQYRETVQRISKIYKDRPTSAMDTAMFWIEYVLRHHGASHLQSPAVHMCSFIYYSIDIALVYGIIIYIIYSIFKFIIKFFIKICTIKSKIKKN